MKCQDIEPLSALYVCDELAPSERVDLEAHVAECEACHSALEKAQSFGKVLEAGPKPEPAPELLASCRVALDDALDREQLGWRALMRAWFWSASPLTASRAAAVSALLILGFGLGWTLRPRWGADQTVAPASHASTLDLKDYRVRGISQVAQDPQSGGVRIALDAERRMILEGSLDDPRIRDMLVNVVKSYDNPGIRRETLDVLRTNPEEPSIREALMCALRDRNPGVRLAALATVNHMECGYDTHEQLLKVAEIDPNVGVRTAAIDALVEHVQKEGPDEAVSAGFEKLFSTDPEAAVRLRCLAALRKFSE
jgi:hypothetical protein